PRSRAVAAQDGAAPARWLAATAGAAEPARTTGSAGPTRTTRTTRPAGATGSAESAERPEWTKRAAIPTIAAISTVADAATIAGDAAAHGAAVTDRRTTAARSGDRTAEAGDQGHAERGFLASEWVAAG